jgi:hypothetical protein
VILPTSLPENPKASRSRRVVRYAPPRRAGCVQAHRKASLRRGRTCAHDSEPLGRSARRVPRCVWHPRLWSYLHRARSRVAPTHGTLDAQELENEDRALATAIHDYIETFHNTTRHHSAPSMLTPPNTRTTTTNQPRSPPDSRPPTPRKQGRSVSVEPRAAHGRLSGGFCAAPNHCSKL